MDFPFAGEKIVCPGSETRLSAMSTAIGSVEEKIRMLPPELQQEVIRYIDQLMERPKKETARKFGFAWAGSLSHLKDRYTSVQLQHKAPEWWN